MSLLDDSQSLDGFCHKCGNKSCDAECHYSLIKLPEMTEAEAAKFRAQVSAEVREASLRLMAPSVELDLVALREEVKVVHKFDDPFSIESILCKDAEWEGYGADSWEKVNCPTCLGLRRKE